MEKEFDLQDFVVVLFCFSIIVFGLYFSIKEVANSNIETISCIDFMKKVDNKEIKNRQS